MILDPTLTLEAVLGGAVTSDQPEFHVEFRDYNASGEVTKHAVLRGELNSTTDVTLVGPPQAGFIREVTGVSITNIDTAVVTLTIKTTDGSTDRIRFRKLLAVGQSFNYGPKLSIV